MQDVIELLASMDADLPPLFPCQKLPDDRYGNVRFAVTVSGKRLLIFWRFSGDINPMHRPTSKGGVLQGLSLLAMVNAVVSTWSPGLAVKGLNTKVSNPCLVRLQDEVTLIVCVKMSRGNKSGRTGRAIATISGPQRAGGSVKRFMCTSITLHRRTVR